RMRKFASAEEAAVDRVDGREDLLRRLEELCRRRRALALAEPRGHVCRKPAGDLVRHPLDLVAAMVPGVRHGREAAPKARESAGAARRAIRAPEHGATTRRGQ